MAAKKSSSSNRTEPLTVDTENYSNGGASETRLNELNDRLQTDYIDIEPNDQSAHAKFTRVVANYVGKRFTPRQMIIIIRILRGLSCLFLVFGLLSNLMYLVFVGAYVTDEVGEKVGGTRDFIIRIYALLLSAIAIIIELDLRNLTKHFLVFKPFISRGLLYFFIAVIINSPNLHQAHNARNKYYDDDAGYNYDQSVTREIPGSTIVFQTVVSFTLGFCGIIYFWCGILCFDRFTTEAFISQTDPLKSTRITSAPSVDIPHIAIGSF